jgi:hypothetical protein
MQADRHSRRRLHPMSRSPAPLRTETSTEEDGSGWAAQRAGATPDVGWREEPAERVPLASTPVPSRPPGLKSSQRQRSPVVGGVRRSFGIGRQLTPFSDRIFVLT